MNQTAFELLQKISKNLYELNYHITKLENATQENTAAINKLNSDSTTQNWIIFIAGMLFTIILGCCALKNWKSAYQAVSRHLSRVETASLRVQNQIELPSLSQGSASIDISL